MGKTKERDGDTAVAERSAHEVLEFWCGTTAKSPWQNYGIEDVEFQSFTEKVEQPDGEMMTQRTRRVGFVIKLARDKAKRLQDFISKALVGPGHPGRRRVFPNTSRPLREGENRLSEYLYLLPVDEAMSKYGSAWRENPPPVE